MRHLGRMTAEVEATVTAGERCVASAGLSRATKRFTNPNRFGRTTTMKHRTSYGTIAALTLFGLAAVAAPSRAANLDLTAGGQLTYEATQSVMVANDLTISLVGGTYAIHDPAEPGDRHIGERARRGLRRREQPDGHLSGCPDRVPRRGHQGGQRHHRSHADVIHSAMVTGGGGPDTIIGGTKDDTIVWNTFDGSDVVDGGPGTDSLFFQSGSSDGTADGYDHDTIAIVQNGAGFALYRDSGNVSMDVQNTEVLLLNTFGGNDTVATTGLAGTTQIARDHAGRAARHVDVRRGRPLPDHRAGRDRKPRGTSRCSTPTSPPYR